MTRWTHVATWPDGDRDTDRVVLRDGLVVGRVHVVLMPYGPDKWSWAVQTHPASSGLADTLDEGLGMIRKLASDVLLTKPKRR
ncbi:hypothetical protein [Paracoccus sulfuroxidans]|uniref:Uncharacterized protein n=1 Tax=Paracoccus sulfuroxidans TaxID=384678 RepID=A0A562NCX5_9RHOB|nr:hypothetical protein [Paracoccus sulfuroxidans]TWI29761.1 hypothetical protein IQ24_03578 [Paracoccus sulfuroxidans]